MNWYKLSSHGFHLPEEILNDIAKISKLIVKYVFDKKTSEEIIETVKVKNTYTKKEDLIPVKAIPKDIYGIGAFGLYNDDLNQIEIFPYNVGDYSSDYNYLLSSYSEILKHEIIHAFDPKVAIRKNRRDGLMEHGNQKEVDKMDAKYELLQEYEFDAYSGQIIDFITRNISLYENKRQIWEWFKSPFSSSIPNFFPGSYSYIIGFWRDNKATFFRRLLSRISNDCPLGGKNAS